MPDAENSATDLTAGDEIVVCHDGNVQEGDLLRMKTVHAIVLITPADRKENEKP